MRPHSQQILLEKCARPSRGVFIISLLSQRALRVFSVLEAYRGANDDIIDALLPFFEPMLSDLTGTVYRPAEFAAKVSNAYRWHFTKDIAEELAPRFAARSWLREIGSDRDEKAYEVIYAPAIIAGPSASNSAIDKTLGHIIDELEAFIHEISPLTAYSRSREQLSVNLVEWLVSIDAYTEDTLRQQIKLVEVRKSGTLGVAELQPAEATGLDDEDRYLCARFVKKLYRENSPWLPDLCRIASIGLLTEVVQDFRKPTTAVKQSDLAIYLDAPVALDALGLSGKAAFENINPILDNLRKIGCQIRIFRASVREIERVLRVMLDYHPVDRTGATANAMRRGEVHERFAADIRDHAATRLRERGIGVVEQDLEQFPNSHVHFSSALNRELFSAIHWHLDPVPREHDFEVLTLVMRKRGYTRTPDVFQVKHLFVTKNAFLSQISRRFCLDHKLTEDDGVPPAIHQRQLATLTWLRTGLGMTEEVPKRYLLAACERVLELRKGMVERARHSVANLSQEQQEQLELLLTQDRSVQVMMDKTLGSSGVVDDGSMPALLEVMRQSLVTEIDKRAKSDIAEARRSARRELAAADHARRAAESYVSQVERALATSSADDRQMILGAADSINKRIWWFRLSLNCAVSLFLILLAALPLLSELLIGVKMLLLAAAGVFGAAMAALQLWDKKTRLGRLVQWYSRRALTRVITERRLQTKLAAHPLTFNRNRFELTPEPITNLDATLAS